ncbi:MAG: ABC transporter permease, partial [Deltaproteobacteria bacterium]|nr:ABC transporter permease [Deltaproteobacteria bacterium]
VTVGVMALIVVIAVMAGFESDLKNRILGIESHVVIMRHGSSFSDYHKILDQVVNTNGVEAATPFVYTQIMLRSSSGVSGAVLRGIDPESAGRVIKVLDNSALLNIKKMYGGKDATGSVPGVILGKELAGNLGLGVGDTCPP